MNVHTAVIRHLLGGQTVEIRHADMLANNNRVNNLQMLESAEFWTECEIYCLLGFDLEKCGMCVKMAWSEGKKTPLTHPDDHRRLCCPTKHADPTGSPDGESGPACYRPSAAVLYFYWRNLASARTHLAGDEKLLAVVVVVWTRKQESLH